MVFLDANEYFQLIYQFKDVLMGTNLTEQRAIIASEFETELNAFKMGLVGTLSHKELETKITELEGIILKYEEKNQKLSSNYNKLKQVNV